MQVSQIKCRADRRLDSWLSSSQYTGQEILRLTVPFVLDSLSIMLISMLITALISSNGEASVAAVSLVGPISNLMTCPISGVAAGGTVVIAHCCGQQNPEKTKRAIGQLLWVTAAVGLVFCLPFLVFPGQVLRLIYPQAEAIVIEKAILYLQGCSLSNIIFSVYVAVFAVLRGLGESKKCLTLTIIINVSYLLFSFLFLNWLNLDILGSALALVLARIAGAAASVISLFFYHPAADMRLRQIFTYDRQLFRSTLHMGIPLTVEQVCNSCGSIVAQSYMLPLGTSAVSTHAIANSLLGVLYAASSAAGNLAVTVVGRCVGAGKLDEAAVYGKRTNQIARILVILSALLFYPLLPLLLKQYHPTPEAETQVRQLLAASLPALLIFWPSSCTLPYTLRAAEDALYPSVLGLAVMWIVSIGLGYLLAIPAGLGLWGVWIATWLTWAVRAICFQYRFRSGKWLKNAGAARD